MPRSARAATRYLAALALICAALAGCSGDDEPAPKQDESSGDARAEDTVETTVRVGAVTGRLGRKPARKVARRAAAVVDRWLDAAYVAGDYPREDFGGSFPGFTKDATRLAAKQPRLMSNAAVGPQVDAVTATRRVVQVDVLAPRGRTAGVTAHVSMDIELTGEVERTDRIRGRLLLTPTGDGLRVFGFDIERGKVKGR